MPSISINPLVPSKPGPPKDPKSFWAPWPAIKDPCATRTIAGAVSFILELFKLAPSVAFSLVGGIRKSGRLSTLFTQDPSLARLPHFKTGGDAPFRVPARARAERHVADCLALVYPPDRGGSGEEEKKISVYGTMRSGARRGALEGDAQGKVARPRRGYSG